jgi:hypothetical protein
MIGGIDMKYTNEHNLPEPVKMWLESDQYDYLPGVFSATRILKPTRVIVLEELHKDELEQDISDVIAPRYGTALHDSFEKVHIPNTIQEIRFFAELDGYKLSGKPDILQEVGNHMELWDLKSTSVWTYIYKSKIEEYRKQLSIYRWLITNGEPQTPMKDIKVVSRNAKIIYIFTDWSRKASKEGTDYPKIRIVVEGIELMTTEETVDFIRGRLGAIHHYLQKPQEKLPMCTNEELWRRALVMKEGRKTPVKKFNTEEDARKFLSTCDSTHSLEWGEVNRCAYCQVTKWCEQYQEFKNANLLAEE